MRESVTQGSPGQEVFPHVEGGLKGGRQEVLRCAVCCRVHEVSIHAAIHNRGV